MWSNLLEPIIGLSPMDGVTDAAFRYIADKKGKPSVLFTEFTSVEGVSHGAVKLLDAFIYHKTDTPTIAQIYGSDVESFYKTTFICCEMGFDAIDINMGCPDAAVARRGGGAALILQPTLAQKIIKTVKRAVKDWSEGKKIEGVDLNKNVVAWTKHYIATHAIQTDRKTLPVSVKTRIGYEEIVTQDWISNLLEMEPAAITVHGRTLKQMYTGEANWEEIGKAAEVARKTSTLLLGNGDITSLEDAHEKINTYKLNGALIGRASFGNPWIFCTDSYQPTAKERLETALEHCRMFIKLTPEGHFLSLRKHLAWYCKGFDGAAEVRARFMHVKNLEDVEGIMNDVISTL